MKMRRILRFAQVEDRTGLKHSAIYERIGEGTFPRPVPLGPKARGWLESEINNWIEQRIAEREAAETAETTAST
jgi:prophage regulatory protein